MTKKLYPLISLIFIISIALASCGPKDVTLEVYAGDALRAPLTQIKASYEEQNPHVTINYNFAASKVLAETIRTLEQGDVAMMGNSAIAPMNEEKLLLAIYPVTVQVAVIAVKEGGDTVTSWDDLSKEGVRIALVNPEMSLIGTLANKMIAESPDADVIKGNVVRLTSDITEALELINAGEIDAAIVMPSLVLKTEGVTSIEIPDELNVKIPLSITVPIYTTNEEEAKSFAEFVASDAGKQVFYNMGFEPIE